MRVALGSLHMAAAVDDQAREGRRGTAPIPLGTRTYLQRNPAAAADFSGRKPEKRYVQGAFLLVTFLCASKEK